MYKLNTSIPKDFLIPLSWIWWPEWGRAGTVMLHRMPCLKFPKPIRTKGIGVDQLPASIRNSSVLTGNNLGRLGNLEALPPADTLEAMRQRPEVQALWNQHTGDTNSLLQALHQLARQWLENRGDSPCHGPVDAGRRSVKQVTSRISERQHFKKW